MNRFPMPALAALSALFSNPLWAHPGAHEGTVLSLWLHVASHHDHLALLLAVPALALLLWRVLPSRRRTPIVDKRRA